MLVTRSKMIISKLLRRTLNTYISLRTQKKINKEWRQGTYSKEMLTQVVGDIKNSNRSIGRVAKLYNITRTRLRHYVNGTGRKEIVSQNGLGGGGKTQLTLECEDQLANFAKF